MVSSLKKYLNIKLQQVRNKCIHFRQNLPPRSRINLSNLIKYNWFPAKDRIEYCIKIQFLSTGMDFFLDRFMKYVGIHSADIAQDDRWHSTYPCRIQD